MKVSVSILSSSIKAADITKKLDKTVADYIHLDIMDGKFTENKTWTFSEVKKIISYSKLPLDVHLMVNNPEKYIEDYAMLNTSYLTFHYEAVKDVEKTLASARPEHPMICLTGGEPLLHPGFFEYPDLSHLFSGFRDHAAGSSGISWGKTLSADPVPVFAPLH